MEHLIFLIQVLSLILAFSSLILLISKRSCFSGRIIFFFSAALVLIMARNFIFAIARYGKISSFFIFPVRFASNLAGGIVYVSLVYLSHLFLMIAMSGLAGRRLSLLVSIPTVLVSLYSISLFVLLLARWYPPPFIRPLLTVTGLSVFPVLTVKSFLILNGIYLAVRSRKDKQTTAFLILLFLGQGADGLFFAFEPLRPLTLLLSMILPYTAFLIILPGIFRERRPPEDGASDLRLNNLCSYFSLTGEERYIVAAIADGKSNKEIAFERNTTLSIIKHRIYQLYKKCGINSRWELLYLLSSQTVEL